MKRPAIARVDNAVWALLYGGLFFIGIGIAVGRAGTSWGWGVVGFGAVISAVGAVLVVVRSRMIDDVSSLPEPMPANTKESP